MTMHVNLHVDNIVFDSLVTVVLLEYSVTSELIVKEISCFSYEGKFVFL